MIWTVPNILHNVHYLNVFLLWLILYATSYAADILAKFSNKKLNQKDTCHGYRFAYLQTKEITFNGKMMFVHPIVKQLLFSSQVGVLRKFFGLRAVVLHWTGDNLCLIPRQDNN